MCRAHYLQRWMFVLVLLLCTSTVFAESATGSSGSTHSDHSGGSSESSDDKKSYSDSSTGDSSSRSSAHNRSSTGGDATSSLSNSGSLSAFEDTTPTTASVFSGNIILVGEGLDQIVDSIRRFREAVQEDLLRILEHGIVREELVVVGTELLNNDSVRVTFSIVTLSLSRSAERELQLNLTNAVRRNATFEQVSAAINQLFVITTTVILTNATIEYDAVGSPSPILGPGTPQRVVDSGTAACTPGCVAGIACVGVAVVGFIIFVAIVKSNVFGCTNQDDDVNLDNDVETGSPKIGSPTSFGNNSSNLDPEQKQHVEEYLDEVILELRDPEHLPSSESDATGDSQQRLRRRSSSVDDHQV